jgi:hypothetical protein
MIAPFQRDSASAQDRRPVARKIYRVITLAALTLGLIALVPTDWVQRDPLIGVFSLIWMAVPLLIVPALAILAFIGSIQLARDWRHALPCWLYVAAIAIILVDLFLFSGEADLWTPAGVLMAASVLAAAWAGWRPPRGPPAQ